MDADERHGEALAMARAELTVAAANVLWVTGNGGYPPGSFTTHLINAGLAADRENHVRLTAAYPEIMTCILFYKNAEDGIGTLKRWARGEYRIGEG